MRMRRPITPVLVLAGIALALVPVGADVVSVDPAPAGAQEQTHSDWAPFIGERRMWCTAATGGAGPCASHHRGWAIDIDMEQNEPVFAAGPGVVGWTDDGCAPMGGDGGCNNRAGNYVAVDHGDHFSRYIHLASFAEGMEIGSPIAAGQLIGYAGNSGTSGGGGAHLHYDEIAHPLSVTQRIFFGPMLACHGDTVVRYPDVLGTEDWQEVPHGTLIRNDGYECLGGRTPDVPPPPVPTEGPGGSVGLAFGDFDADGHDDLVVGIAGEGIGRRDNAGSTAVVYGSPGGPGETEPLRQGKGLKGKAERGDMLGAAVATGDFDCDGRDDLAIGAPGEAVGSTSSAGVVSVSYGNARDVNNRAVLLRQGKWGLAGPVEAGDLLGASLAAADFDGDGCDDLAMGAPGEAVGRRPNAGAVLVIYGGSGGFGRSSRTSDGLLHQEQGLGGITEAGDLVGAALAAGDFDCDGFADLAVGAPGESVEGAGQAGAVSVVHGSATGLGADPITIYQSSGLAGILESGDRVGTALAAGDFDGDGCDDLAAGAPSENLTGGGDAGVVSVAFGSPSGFDESTVHYQTDGGLGDTIGADDNVGAALAAVDLDCDGFDDLAVGAPGEGGDANSGWVGVMRGSPSGMAGPLASFEQSGGGLPGRNETGDQVGASLAGGDIDGDGCGDLAIGAPGESIGRRSRAGRVLIVLGGSSATSAVSSHYQSKNMPGSSEAEDHLGGPGVWQLLGLSLQ